MLRQLALFRSKVSGLAGNLQTAKQPVFYFESVIWNLESLIWNAFV